jgi:hypothetical protein
LGFGTFWENFFLGVYGNESKISFGDSSSHLPFVVFFIAAASSRRGSFGGGFATSPNRAS